MAMTLIPKLDRTSPSFKQEVDMLFAERLPTFTEEAAALDNKLNATAETLAVAQAAAHTASIAAEAAALTAGATLYVPGAYVPKGKSVISQIDGHTYRKMTNSADAGDPSGDASNWLDLTAANKDEAERASAAAATARAGAEAARDAAQLTAGIYSDVQAGLAATTSGRYFSVPASDGIDSMIMYRNSSGTAVEVSRYPAAAEVRAIGGRISKKLPDLALAPAQEDLLVSIVDSDMHRTWLEARAADGGPSEYSKSHMRRAVGLDDERAHQGILAGVMDSEGRLTDLVVRDSDGQVPDWVIARWAPRIAMALYELLPRRLSIVESYTPGSDLQPLYPTMSKIAGWGSSSMEGLALEMGNLANGLGAAYFDGGRSSEWSTDSCARMGSIPAVLTVAGGAIPASGPVAVTCVNTTLTDALKPYTGTLNGVYGTLAQTAGVLSFTRATDGAAVQATGEYAMTPDKGIDNRASVTLLWLGKNDLAFGVSAADVIGRTDASFDWLAPMVKRCLVLGQFVNGDTPAVSAVRDKIYAVNEQQKARYGDLFIDVHALITSPNVWAETGITPTQEDLDYQAIGNKPPSLSRDPWHLNAAGNALVRKAVEARIKALNWYAQ